MYYFTFIYLLVLVFYGEKFPRKTRFFLALAPLVLIAFLRYGVGADYFSYEYIYLQLGNANVSKLLTEFGNIEFLFRLLVFICSHLGINYHIFAAISSTLLIGLTVYWLYTDSANFEQSIFLYYCMLYFYWSLSALRQGIVLIVLLYVFFNKKNQFSTKSKIIFSIVGFFFHATALIVPVIYILSKMKWNKVSFVIMLIVSPISRLIFSENILMKFSGIPYVKKILSYISYDSIRYFSLPSLLRLALIFIVLFHYDRLRKERSNEISINLVNFSLLSLIGYFYLPFAMVIGTRITIFGYFLLILIIPEIIALYKHESLYKLSMALFISFSTVSFYNEYSKLTSRTGYLGNMHELNKETIFNSNYEKFNNPYIFYLQVNEDDTRWFKENKKLVERVNGNYISAEKNYNKNNHHTVVKFESNGKYGVINQNGEVVVLPVYDNEPVLLNNFLQIDERFGKATSYYYIQMSENELDVGQQKKRLKHSMVKDEIESAVIESYSYNKGTIVIGEYNKEQLFEYPFIKDYNLTPVEIVKTFKYDNNFAYEHLKLLTVNKEYFIIRKNGVPLGNKIYNEIDTNNNKIMIGYTNSRKEYINSDGDVIWFEYLVD